MCGAVSWRGYLIKSCSGLLCQFLLSVGPVRVRTSLYKCTVQCTLVQRTQYRAVCSTAAIADSDVRGVRREAVRAWPGVKQFTKQQV